jgi:tetratricopeptide (TPR) repeat protein
MGMGFVPGSLAATYVSTDARTFKEPAATWVPSASNEKSAWFEGTPQSLVGDLIREGVTGVAGQVAEPFLQSAIRADILFPAYLAGSNLVEAFYAAMPHLSWQTVVVGDPLCAPFRRRTLTRAEIEGGIDDETTLPAFFSQRRVKDIQASLPGVPERAVALSIRGDTLAARDRAGAQAAWEQATALAPQIASAQFQLALIYDQAGQTDLAIERYRATLASQPANSVALNNLAYKLAVDRKAPAEALPLATQAAKLAPGNATILDTLAWVQYLSGDYASATKTMAAVLKSVPNHPEIRLHAATIYAASGARAVAEDNLREALRLNPALENTPVVKQLRQQLEKSGSSK